METVFKVGDIVCLKGGLSFPMVVNEVQSRKQKPDLVFCCWEIDAGFGFQSFSPDALEEYAPQICKVSGTLRGLKYTDHTDFEKKLEQINKILGIEKPTILWRKV